MVIPFTTDRVKLTSGYGSRILGGKTDFHGGYDLVGIGSTDVTAAGGGKVVASRMVTDKSNLMRAFSQVIKNVLIRRA